MGNLDDIKKLSPEERIKRLKELEEERKKEIEEARKLMTSSLEEVEDQKKENLNIPIPQLRAIDATTLFGGEEKEMFRMKRYDGAKTPDQRTDKGGHTALEETVRREAVDIPSQRNPYGAVLEEIKTELYDLQSNQNWGQEEKDRFYNVQEKMKDMGQKYQSVSNYVSNLMSAAKEMENKLRYVR